MVWKNVTFPKEFFFIGLSSNSMQVTLFVTFLVIYLIILLANSLIILATVMDRNLHTPMYFFLTNLSVVDIFFSSSVVPRMLRDMLAAKKTITFAQCAAQMYIHLSVGMAQCIFLAILGYDRYIAICYPLHYTTIISRAVCIKMASASWICAFSLAIAVVSLIPSLDFCGHNVINHFFCEAPAVLSLGCSNVEAVELLLFLSGITLLVTPISFIILTYIKIITSIFKISSASQRKKSFSTCASHISVVTLSYGSGMANYMRPQSKSSPSTGKHLAIFYTIVTPMMNPLIYSLRNKDFKSALKKVLSRLKRI